MRASLILILGLICLGFGQVAQQCLGSADPCSVRPCPCAGFTVLKIQTDPAAAITTVSVNVTNYCTTPVYYVNFGLTDGKTTLQPVNVPNPYTGQYKWTTDTNYASTNPSRTWISFKPYPDPATPRTQMAYKGGGQQWEVYTFNVKNYNPLYGWYFQLHAGNTWDTFGPLDMSLCQCTNCDAGFSQRTIEPCVVGYANAQGVYSGTTNRASSVFNENQVLYSYGMYNNYLGLFYADEYPMTLGVKSVTNNVAGTPNQGTTNFPFSDGTQQPTCIYGNQIQFGGTSFDGRDILAAIDANGPNNGCNEILSGGLATVGKTCGRPMAPTLFISDLTTDKTNRTGDWQYYGTPYLPHKICGLWQASVKTITGKKADGTYTFDTLPITRTLPTPNQNPAGQTPYWNLGLGADPPPLGFVNPSAVGLPPYLNKYGVEVAWDLDKLPLISSHSYRFQFLVHDGDSTKVGGDVGQGCLITNQACPAGFFGTNCDVCDTNPVPRDNSWTWFCSITGSEPPYKLLKLPVEKAKNPPYAGNGFIPSLNFNDSAGYLVGCDCVRKTYKCPLDCCGNGVCKDNIGVCECANKPAGFNASSCCVPPVPPPQPPPPTCTANVSTIPRVNCSVCVGEGTKLGLSCSWCSGVGIQPWNVSALTNGTCMTAGQVCATTEFRTCTLPPPPPPPPTCLANVSTIPRVNCSICLGEGTKLGLSCSWCVNGGVALWNVSALSNGTCRAQAGCAPGQVELKSCVTAPPPAPVVVPCANVNQNVTNNCSNCVNNRFGSACAWCPLNSSAPGNLTLTQGRCSDIGKCGGAEFYKCVAPPPPPPPATCAGNLSTTNCSGCVFNQLGLNCNWCPRAGTSGNNSLVNGTCQANCSGVGNVKVCSVPPPPPSCTQLTTINKTDCNKCISNYLNLTCGWCPLAGIPLTSNASLVNGTCIPPGTACPTGAKFDCKIPVPPCFNDGKYCSGKGSCVNGTCICRKDNVSGVDYKGPACNISVFPPPFSCKNLTGIYNCSDCLAKGAIRGLQCAWCPNTTNPLRVLTSGVCVEDYICGNSSYYACIPPALFIPPECADNCSGHGYCVNVSTCRAIQQEEQQAVVVKYTNSKGEEVTEIYTCSEENLNATLANNQSALCACIDPYTGVNCGIVGAGINITLAAGLAAGIIAAIVVLGLLGAALCGGGAYAAASALGAAPSGNVVENPLYTDPQTAGGNPLYV